MVHENEGQYPDLREKQTYITKVIRTEEENFARTIDGGMKIFSDLLAEHKAEAGESFLRRRRLQAVRYLRLPHRPDHGDGGGRGHAAWTRTPSRS